jgi:hypothetical protein
LVFSLDFVSCHPSGNLDSEVALPARINLKVPSNELNVNRRNLRRQKNLGFGKRKDEKVRRIEGI